METSRIFTRMCVLFVYENSSKRKTKASCSRVKNVKFNRI